MIHPEAIEATERLYNAWRTGQDVRVTDVINDALDKALKRPTPKTPASDIAQIVCDYFHVDRKLAFKRVKKRPCRERHVTIARWFVFLMLRESDKSANQIGRMFGSDHGTILNGLRGIRKLMQANPDREGRQYKELKNLIQQTQP